MFEENEICKMIFRAQQSHNNARTQDRLSVKNAQASDGENRTCLRYLNRFKMHMNVLPFGKKKNVFMLPTGPAAKKYITETTKLMNGWTNNSQLKDITFEAIHVTPSLLLQKSSKTSKTKDHLKALERRIDLWSKGKIDELLFKWETILGELSNKLPLLMKKRNVNGALELLTSNISNGILPLDDKTLSLLQQKHPASSELNEEVLLRGEEPFAHPVVFEDIDESSTKDQRWFWSPCTRCRWMEKYSCVQELRNN